MDKTCKIFDLDNRECLAILYGHSCPITSSSINSGLAVSGCEKSVINLWKVALLNPSTESKIYSIHFQDRQEIDDQDDVFAGCFTGHSNTITALELQENTLLSGSLDKTARQWDIETGTCISILRSESAIEASRMSVIDTIIYGEPIPGEIGWSERSSQIPIYNVSGGVSALQFWMHALAVGYNDGSLRLFDLRSVSCTRVLKSHSDVITSLKFDSNTIVTASQDHTLNIWDLRMGIVTETIEFSRPLSGCCFDSRKVYVAGERDLKVYDRSSAIVDSWKGHVSIVSKVEKYGVDVISAGRDGIVKLWS